MDDRGRWVYRGGGGPSATKYYNDEIGYNRDYRWEPYDCEIAEMSTKELQKCASGKQIAFAGDSLAREMFTNYMQLLKGGPVDFDGRAIKGESAIDIRESFKYDNAAEDSKIIFFVDSRSNDMSKICNADKNDQIDVFLYNPGIVMSLKMLG